MINEEIQKPTNQDRIGLLSKEKTETGNHLTLCVTCNKTLPNIKTIIEKHWHILNVNPELRKVLENKPLLAFRRNKNLRQLIGGNTTGKNKKLLTTNKFTNGKCLPCFSNSRTLCCKQVIKTEHFKSNLTNRTFRILKKTTCKVISSYSYQNANFVKSNMMEKLKQPSIYDSTITEKMSKTLNPYLQINTSINQDIILTYMLNSS